MFVKSVVNKRNGRVFISYYEGKREGKKVCHVLVKPIGYLDELEHDLAWYREEAKRLTEEKAKEARAEGERISNFFNYEARYDKRNENNRLVEDDGIMNFGVAALSKVYHELEMDSFMNNRRRYENAQYNHNSIFKMLVYSRILYPDSKLATWRGRERLIEKYAFSDDDVYRSFSFFAKHKDALLAHVERKLREKGIRSNSSLLYYDVTNYYWETDEEDMLRKRGCSKEHRPEPIVQMGLMMDKDGIPVSYGLFPGNNNDVTTFRPMMEERGKDVIYVADKGMMSGMNIASIIMQHNGFIISASLRNAGREVQSFVLDKDGYRCIGDGEAFMYKERFVPVKINIKDAEGKTRKASVNIRQIVFFSSKYKERARREREKAVSNAMKQAMTNPKAAVLNEHGAGRYMKKTIFDSDSQEIVDAPEFSVALNEDLIRQQEELDGYYLIHTNVFQSKRKDGVPYFSRADNTFCTPEPAGTLDIIDMYRGLWRIEHCFRITKSVFRTRPVYVRKEESIEAHFLTCYTALVILKVLERKTEGKIESEVIVDSLRKAVLTEIDEGNFKYKSCYCSNALYEIGKALSLPLNQRKFTEANIRRLIADSKKS